MALRKSGELDAIGLTSKGAPVARGSALTDASAFYERFPERMWPWLPVIAIALIVILVTATVLVAVTFG